jgi:carbonic anhydrase
MDSGKSINVPPDRALSRLREGNRRFANGVTLCNGTIRPTDYQTTRPFAVVLGCADARVTPEFVFDQGLGDLFAVRVAGAAAGPVVLDSIELAVKELATRLIVVLGHTDCRAVAKNLRSRGVDPGKEYEEAVEQSVIATISKICDLPSLAESFANDAVTVVGAVYSVKTGQVRFLGDAAEVRSPA